MHVCALPDGVAISMHGCGPLAGAKPHAAVWAASGREVHTGAAPEHRNMASDVLTASKPPRFRELVMKSLWLLGESKLNGLIFP